MEKKSVGVTITPTTEKIRIVAHKDLLTQGEPILGKLLGIETEVMGIGKVEVLVKVLSYKVENPFGIDPQVAQRLRELIEKARAVRDLVELREALILECEPITAFSEAGTRIPLDFPLKTFLNAYEVDPDFLQNLKKQREALRGELWYLGYWHGTKLPLPVWLADPRELDEAYHAIIVGQTGSGKSTLAKMLLLGYACASADVNLIVLDPAGEFSAAFKDRDRGRFKLNLGQLWKETRREEPQVYGIEDLIFDRWEIFEELLKEKEAFLHLNIKHPENQGLAASYLTNELRNRKKIELESLGERVKDDHLLEEILLSGGFLDRVYSDQRRRKEVEDAVKSEGNWKAFLNAFSDISERFRRDPSSRRIQLRRLVWGIIRPEMRPRGRTMIIDLSGYSWEDPIKYLIIKELLDHLYNASLASYKREHQAAANTLVVIDEVHRIAPSRELGEEVSYQRDCKRSLIKAFMETRKYGLGWTVISTRLSTIDRNLYEHARVKIIGWGLSTGRDADILRELYGREFLEAYRKLPDPSDPFSERRHVFVIEGPICVLSRGPAEFIQVFDNPEEFLEGNQLGHEVHYPPVSSPSKDAFHYYKEHHPKGKEYPQLSLFDKETDG